MSSKLVKKSLELFEDDLSIAVETVKKKKKKKKEQNLMALMSTKKRGVKKELQRLQNQKKQEKQKKDKNKKLTADNSLFYQPEDFTEASVSSLCKVSRVSKVGEKTTRTIVKYHLTKNRKGPLKKKDVKRKKKKKTKEEEKQQEQSVFTDEDFEKFFLEYNDPLNTG